MQTHRSTPRLRIAALLAVVSALALPQAAPAITGGVLDGSGHPNAGMLADEEDGKRGGACSGFYAGEHKSIPGTGVFLTAAHCLADRPADAKLWVTFETNVTFTEDETFAASWYEASGFAVHPDFRFSASNTRDYGVVLLKDTVPVTPVAFPREGLLGDLAARGDVRPRTYLDIVGYGLIPTFKGGPKSYEFVSGRMLATSRFSALTQPYVGLLGNPDAEDGLGGACFGDSGAPIFVHGTNRIVAQMSGGGDAVCRSKAFGARLDIPAARSFLGQYVELP
jgi:hypothetical protein